MIALRNLGYAVRVAFASELDGKVMDMLRATLNHFNVEYEPGALHSDMATRPSYEKGDLDLYFSSCPCQTWSPSGLRQDTCLY